MNLARTETAHLAELACKAYEDNEKLMLAKMIQEFKFTSNLQELCEQLCELEAFRYWKPKELARKFTEAKEDYSYSQITTGPLAGNPIFGSHD
jgi:hypothetical protein